MTKVERAAYGRKRYAERPGERERVIARTLAKYYAGYRTSVQGKGQELKVEVLKHYGHLGILQCVWEGCEVDDPDMLTLDHKNNDGAEHRRTMKGSLYQWVKSHGYPEGFQTLCANHQLKKELLRRFGIKRK
jgi:hypothetical protein